MDDNEIAAMWACRDLAIEMQHAPEPTPNHRVVVRCDHSNNRFDREQGCIVCVGCGVILMPQIFTDAYNNLTFTGDKCGKVSMYKRVMAFCMCMIAFNDGKLEVFLPLMTSTASVWVPTPTPPSRKVPTPPPSPQLAEPSRS